MSRAPPPPAPTAPHPRARRRRPAPASPPRRPREARLAGLGQIRGPDRLAGLRHAADEPLADAELTGGPEGLLGHPAVNDRYEDILFLGPPKDLSRLPAEQGHDPIEDPLQKRLELDGGAHGSAEGVYEVQPPIARRQ